MLLALAPSIQAIVGRPVPEWPHKPQERWVQGGPLTLESLRGKVVLLRFFTEADCPHCRATAPSLNEFHDEFASRGLALIGMYTPKPGPRPVAIDVVRASVKDYGFTFPIALDDDWGALRRLWLDRVPAAGYTSASLLIDRRGILRYVQTGGTYAKEAADARARDDYRALRDAIVVLLSEPAR